MAEVMILGAPPLSPGHEIAVSGDELSRMVRAMRSSKVRGMDVETSGLRYADGDHPVGYSMGYLGDSGIPRVWYVPYRHQTVDAQAVPEQAARAFADALEGAEALVGHNLKFDLNMCRAHGLAVSEDVQLHDTMIQAHLIYERRRLKLEKLAEQVVQFLPWDDSWEMEELVSNYCRSRAADRGMVYKRSNKREGIKSYLATYGHAEVPVQLEAEYSCRDIGHTLMLDRVQRDQAMGLGTHFEDRAKYLYRNEMLLVRALAEMEWHGQPVDKQYLLRKDREVKHRLDEMGRELTRVFSRKVDWTNDNAVRHHLYKVMKLPVVKRTERSNKPAVDRSALLQLKSHHPGIELLAEHNVWLKVWQTYTASMAWWVDQDRKIHPSFNQPGTKTGRLSGRNPNFQNIPIRHKEASKSIRGAFYLPEGRARVYCDYSQVELRILAWATGARNLLAAYQSDAYEALLRGDLDYEGYRKARKTEPSTDVHGAQAKSTFGARESDADWKLKRRAAKIINFGVPYGMGPQGLTTNPSLLLDRSVAEGYFEQYHRANPEIGNTKDALFSKMLKEKVPYFVNWAGRTCHARELRSRNRDTRSEGERSTFATLIQGSAGELTRFAIVGLYLAQKSGRIPAVATSTVHDEIQMDCDEADVVEVGLETQRIMEDFTGLFGEVPIIADLEVTTTTWAEKKDMHA